MCDGADGFGQDRTEFTDGDSTNGAVYDRAVYLYAMGRLGGMNSDIGDTTIAYLKDKHPDAYHVIVNQNLSNAQQAKMIYEIDVKKRDVDEVVEEWMEANEAVWRKWLP